MEWALLTSVSYQNVQAVPVSPKVKSSKTCKLFKCGVSEMAGSAKSVDPIVYNARVGWGNQRDGLFETMEMNMERSIAIKKLGSLLGKSLGYRIDPKAPNQEERDAARSELPAANETKKSLTERMEARRREILQGDAEYQRLRADCDEARKRCDRLFSIANHYKITVGVSNSMFFTVHAQGDSWEQVIEKLTVKQAAA